MSDQETQVCPWPELFTLKSQSSLEAAFALERSVLGRQEVDAFEQCAKSLEKRVLLRAQSVVKCSISRRSSARRRCSIYPEMMEDEVEAFYSSHISGL